MTKEFKIIKILIHELNSIFIVTILLAIFSSPVYAHDQHDLPWGYEGGTGPEHWGEIEHDHEKHLMCREGSHQSPIDINHVLGVKLSDLGCNFSPAPIQIVNNGHTIHLSYSPGSYIDWGTEKYELVQFHFHSPSEHQVNGKHYDMEVHLVHKTQDHQYVVVGIFMNKGKHNPHIQKIWDRIPNEKHKEVTYNDELFNVESLLPATKEYFHYSGSLTTPPCSENVSWFLLEQPIEVSSEQIQFFKKHIEHNARPTQKMHHRIVVKVK